MILAILFAYYGYKKAGETGRNKVLWAILMAVIFIGVQFLTGILVGVVGITMSDLSFVETYYWPINIAGAIASIAVCSGILYWLGSSPKVDLSEPPPPPAEFS